MLHRWRQATFLHWRYPAEVVQALLPAGLRVETFDGTAWVGLIPFVMEVRVPWLGRFPETNVRTYVRGPDGRTGIWFFSLDAARLAAVAGGRAGFGLPYHWAAMRVDEDGADLRYRSRRRGGTHATNHALVRVGAPLTEPGPLAEFLTARLRLYAVMAGRLVAANARHGPWPLRAAEVPDLHDELVPAAGLPAPDTPPLVHASPGVEVSVGAWRPLRGPRR